MIKCPRCGVEPFQPWLHAQVPRLRHNLEAKMNAEIKALIEKLENYYSFECEGGLLMNCKDWMALKSALRASPSEAEQRKWVEVDKVPEWANEFASGQLTAYYPIRDEAGDDTGKYWAYTCPDVPDRSPHEGEKP
jgi:hypothetical protein